MSLTDEPDGGLTDRPAPETHVDEHEEPVPTKSTLWWPVVQALRELGQSATDAEVADHVADSLNLTQRQRTQTIPSGQETRLKNRVGWAAFELKEIGAVHYPKPGYRALTDLGLSIDEEQITALRAEFILSKSPPEAEQPKGHEQAGTPVAWLIRAGGEGEFSDYNVEHGLARIGYTNYGRLPDLRTLSSYDDLVEAMRSASSDTPDGALAKPKTIEERARQLWMFGTEVLVGHLVVMPRMTDQIAVGVVSQEYWYDEDGADPDWPHRVSVKWKDKEVLRTDLKDDLLSSINAPGTIHPIRSTDAPWRLQQVMDTGRDPGARVDDATGPEKAGTDLPALIEEFYRETGYPTDAHEEQERLRKEWARKLAPENVGDLSPKDLLAYTSNAVDYGQYVTLKEGLQQQWIDDLDHAGYNRLLVSIHDLCWGEDELSTRIDRLVKADGSSRQDTGTTGFAQGNLNATLAICHPDRFLPVGYHGGHQGRRQMLSTLGLPEPRGSTFGQRMVDSHNRLREHLAPHLRDDPQAIACFLYWLTGQKAGVGGLADLVRRFRAGSGYPTAAHEEQKRLRAEWAEKLAPEHIADFSRLDLTGVASRGTLHRARYVYPDVQGVMKWIRQLDDDEYSGLLDSIDYLCWGEDEDEAWVRYDQLTDRRNPRRLRGYAHPTAIRLLAITHPKDFLPLGPYPGVFSRLRRYLDLDRPQGSSYGQRVMDANNRLLEHLEPHFGDDTLEMSAFLEWLIKEPPPPDDPDLAELADELLVDVEFLEDIVELLKDKGQVILYGPPGTGKTYLARKLAEELAPDESCRTLVQFHPSTSYEDFFEGYRPAGTGDDGGIRYELTPGPLARMVERAKASDQRHVMIIDEINRGNLPRVLGELLFLLEYRNESVQTLYRVEEPFLLPKNLWFIGTMNTADRSIALVDAALRRRFHFVPFFPDSGPMAGLLNRWLEDNDEPAWIGHLVDAVNIELKEVLEGSHLLLGPSHFMKEYGSSPDEHQERLRRIWEYNIEPFIEDQFFGSPDQIARFRFEAVLSRHRPAAEPDADASYADGDYPEITDASEDS